MIKLPTSNRLKLIYVVGAISLLFLLGRFAGAQVEAVPMEPLASPKWDLLLNILQLCAPILTAVLGWIGIKVAALIRVKIKNQLVASAMVRLTDAVITYVREAEQTMVTSYKTAKKADSPGGEKLSAVEATRIKEDVVAKIKALWGIKGLEQLGKILGLSDTTLTDYIHAKVEEVVQVEKRSPQLPLISPRR